MPTSFLSVPRFELTYPIAEALTEALTREYNQPFSYKKVKGHGKSYLYLFTSADEKHRVGINPRNGDMQVDEHIGHEMINIAKVKELLLAIIDSRPRITDIQTAVANRERRKVTSALVRKPDVPMDVIRNIGDYAATRKIEGGRRRKTRKMKKTRKTRRV